MNSNSTGWQQNDFNSAGTDAVVVVVDAANGTVTYKQTTPFFKADDKYAQILLKAWSGTVDISAVDILDKDGNKLNDDSDEVAKPAEPAAPAEPEAPEADEDVDEPEEPAAPAEPAAEVAPAVENTPAPATGNTAVATVVAVMAVAGAAAIASKKRK